MVFKNLGVGGKLFKNVCVCGCLKMCVLRVFLRMCV